MGAGEGREAAGQDHVPAGAVHLPGSARRRTRSGRIVDHEGPLNADPRRDPLTPIVIALRWSTLGIGVFLAAGQLGHNSGYELATVLLVVNSAVRTMRPLHHAERRLSSLFFLLDLTITFAAVAASGRWESPFIFALIVPVFLAGFGRGYLEGFVVASIAALAVTVLHIALASLSSVQRDVTAAILVLELTALLAGYARHVFIEAQERHEDAVGRMAQLTEANALLLALHEVAQTLPSSLDLEETMNSARARLHELFDFTSLAILLTGAGGTWTVGLREGVRLPNRVAEAALPDPIRRAIAHREPVLEYDLTGTGRRGVSARGQSGLYVPLEARGRLVAVLAMEHLEPDRFQQRERGLVSGVVEPLALAIDNALWFRRLRSLGAEEERVRIARELHDRTAQSLAYVGFELDRLAIRHAADADVQRLRDEVRDIVSEVRDTLYELRAGVSEQVDLRTTASEYIPRFVNRTGINVTFAAARTGRAPARVEQELFRILQEALRNIEQHAGASQASVTWDAGPAHARLVVVDEGTGFDPAEAAKTDHYGLVGIRERASEIGARCELDAAPGRGTTVIVEWEGRT